MRRDWEVARWLGCETLGDFYAKDEVDQEEAIDLWLEEKGRCPDCGRPRRICSDPTTEWFVNRTVCYATRALEWGKAAYGGMHEKKPWHDGTFGVVADWAEHQSRTHPHHAMHGVNLWVDTTEHDPADNFTGRRASCPTALREPLGLGPPPDPAEDQDDPYGVPPPPDGPPDAHPGPGHDTELNELDEHTR